MLRTKAISANTIVVVFFCKWILTCIIMMYNVSSFVRSLKRNSSLATEQHAQGTKLFTSTFTNRSYVQFLFKSLFFGISYCVHEAVYSLASKSVM